MPAPAISDIEGQFARLSPDAQLSLLERLVHRVRLGLGNGRVSWETELGAMAVDPEVQKELNSINVEFHATEGDGLGRE
jgi:hypothetical protein